MKNLLLCVFLLIGLGQQASSLAGTPGNSPSTQAVTCNLAAPENFQITSAGSTWLTLRWNLVAGAIAYDIKIYANTSAPPVFETRVPDNGITINNLDPGVYTIELRSVCQNSEAGVDFDRVTVTTIILDLTINLLPINPEYCEDLMNGTENPLPWGETCWLRVRNASGAYCMFELRTSAAYSGQIGKLPSITGINACGLSPRNMSLSDESGVGAPASAIGHALIKDFVSGNAVPVCEIYLTGTPSMANYSLNIINQNYSVQFVDENADAVNGQASREGRQLLSTDAQESGARLLENPTEDNATILFDPLPDQTMWVSVMSLEGKIMYEETITGQSNLSRIELTTAGLPAGLYLLKIQGRAQSKTLKLLKK